MLARVVEASGRPGYEQVPQRLREWVDRELGSPVASAASQPGGFSPGVAARLVTADGARAFVKAIATSRHAATAALHRYESQAMLAIPAGPALPRLYATYDDGDWVGLLLEDIEGRHPVPWTLADVHRVTTVIDQRVRAFTPSPWPEAERLEDAPRMRTSWWTQATEDLLPSWVRAHRRKLIALEDRVPVAVRGQTLCHRDVLAENILLTPADGVVFVDWAWACQGAAWIDTMNLICGVAMDRTGIDVDALISASPRTRETEPETLTAYLANTAGSAYVKAQRSGPQNIPALQAFRQRRATALLEWLQRRTGW
jgi:Phosphotransferase enzyme family